MRLLKLMVFLFLLQGCAAQPATRLIDATQETVTKEVFDYYLYFPEAYGTQPDEKFPLLLFLHGGGEAGDSLVAIKRNGPPKLITEGKQFPFLILAPQNPHKKKWWNTVAVKQLLDTIVANNRVDTKRIYLTGLSRGGGAAWEMAVQYPDTFAALAVVCGMTPLPYAAWLDKNMPIWVFHGEEDKSIPISESETMVERLLSMGYDVKFTRYKGVGHNSWIQAYNTEELYDWFVRQSRND
ncbi:prolyl oligopeptidase family serine peptidase [Flavobacteriaceae bacterium TP-CH-4]|uniref:Prolyl oligopeptidase family serine peptidase n=1 Tax=Pelagihabitans pacificus TaxID=2696054 RepID=A0A967AVU0_9FLAO|nr:PHB depolymerase family esterase [Pelagihabitans pacificus]NHF61118.1 prolyl oligopeptidase family serine peptidase [Pelagihabitans pacificus]